MDGKIIKKLIEEAATARLNARAPISGFRVGAALLAEDGQIIKGCNMEIANMFDSICAERCALAKAISEGHKRFTAIAVVSDAPEPIAPCGICRQTLIDFGEDWLVIMSNPQADQVKMMKVGELLPNAYLAQKVKSM